MSVLNKLTEGIVSRDLRKEGDALLGKWEKTGLLEGLDQDQAREGMARLLENQAKQLLKEASTMSGGDVEGFAAVAFPLVRRVFGGLLANDIVSVQPMSLPSGLIFFLDFQATPSTNPRLGMADNDSLYGGGRVASEITGGVKLGETINEIYYAESSFYGLNHGYTSPTSSLTTVAGEVPQASGIEILASGTVGGVWYVSGTKRLFPNAVDGSGSVAADMEAILRYDPDIPSGSQVAIGKIMTSKLTNLNKNALAAIRVSGGKVGVTSADNTTAQGRLGIMPHGARHVARLNQFSGSHKGLKGDDMVLVVVVGTGTTALGLDDLSSSLTVISEVHYPTADNFTGGGSTGSVIGASPFGLENDTGIPEIDIKVDSVAVTAITKKLKAKWTPELGQDLNAYHNLDAEVELTSILSEQIALEIDREIIGDLVVGATAGTYYWARSPGMFLERNTGKEVGASSAAPDFTGTVSEWYETLIETINDVSAQIHRKTLRGGANFVVVSPEVANILEFTSGFRASVTADEDRGTIGAVKTGSLSKKFDVFVDPYFPRNVVLVGRKGGSFLESGYVYAPYVPLQVTPTIFGIEDFVPRKGVMTRYAKKMVRPDMYGLVIVRGLLGEAGATS